jgi:hypothetical protein
MRDLGDGTRHCDACDKRVHTIESERDAERVVREARARNEAKICVRVAVAALALTSCAAHETKTVSFPPMVAPPPPVVQFDDGPLGEIYVK